jgi:hypothetical protein
MAELFTDQSVSYSISNFAFLTRVEFAYKASQFQYKLWEKQYVTDIYQYLCVGEVKHPVYPPPSGTF